MRVALVSRELYPLGGGGIGQFVNAAASLLSRVAEVVVLTSSAHEERYRQLRWERDPRLPPEQVHVAFAPEPTAEEAGRYTSFMHCYSARVWQRLRELYPVRGPDLVEFADYLGEGFVTVQAGDALDRFLERTLVCVRAHTTAEMCAVLNGHTSHAFDARATHELERFAIGRADRLIWQGGDILDSYRRFYGDRLAQDARIRYPFRGPRARPGEDSGRLLDPNLRLLYVGRFERRKGVNNLLRAAAALDRADWRLTMVGGDTDTGPLGTSMRDQLLAAWGDDPRVDIREEVPRGMLGQVIRDHDVVVLPSLWECWPYAALEAMHLNRPVLATPVGGLAEMVRPGSSGWLAADPSRDSLQDALDHVLDDRDRLWRRTRDDAPRRRAEALAPDAEIVDAYEQLVRDGAPRLRRRTPPAPASANGNGRTNGGAPAARSPSRLPPLVTAIVPYYRMARFVEDTVASLFTQTHPRLDVVIVNDGSFEDEDWILAELAASYPLTVISQQNSGLGAARNLGAVLSRGRYVFPLDADNAAEPTFVERCVEVLEERPEADYVTAWSTYVVESGEPEAGPDDGWQPLGNEVAVNEETNVAGDAAALIRRRVFELGWRYSQDLTSYEDWGLYRQLGHAGRRGIVIPERLIRYRVRSDSMTQEVAIANRQRIVEEVDAHTREGDVRWTSSSA